jgi:hypothetical protein
MHDDDLRREFGTLLKSIRQTAPPEIPVIRYRLSRLRRRRAMTAGMSSVAAVAAVALTVVAVRAGAGGPDPRSTELPQSGSHSASAHPRPASTGQWWKAPYTVSTPVTNLIVTADVDTVTVVGSQRSTTSVTVTVDSSRSSPSITRTLTGGTLQLAETCPNNESCDVSITVQVPRDITAQVTDSVGDISLSGLSGEVTATNSDGDIDATNMTSRTLNLRDDTGDISATLLTPPDSLRAGNSVGAIDIGLPGSASYRVDAPSNFPGGPVHVAVRTSSSSPYSVTADDDLGSVSITTGAAA